VNAAESALPAIIEDDPGLDETERIRALAAQGLSRNAIQRRLFGYTGGAAFEAVRDALE
jgi:hypothetical protein